jgi:hypothetical protein
MKNKTILNLKTKKRLAQFIRCSVGDLPSLRSDDLYRVFTNDSGRIIEEPTGLLKQAHKAVFSEINQEQLPDWYFSCKGKGYIENAKVHANEKTHVLKIDIHHFYRSCDKRHVFQLFKDKNYYGLPGDIAGILADILTVGGHIPTGSSASQLIALWSYYDCLAEIASFAIARRTRLSVYVDDIVFSSEGYINASFEHVISEIFRRHALNIKEEKIKRYLPTEDKLITGAAIKKDGSLDVPNKLRKKIYDERVNGNITTSTIGRIRAARQIKPDFAY